MESKCIDVEGFTRKDFQDEWIIENSIRLLSLHAFTGCDITLTHIITVYGRKKANSAIKHGAHKLENLEKLGELKMYALQYLRIFLSTVYDLKRLHLLYR